MAAEVPTAWDGLRDASFLRDQALRAGQDTAEIPHGARGVIRASHLAYSQGRRVMGGVPHDGTTWATTSSASYTTIARWKSRPQAGIAQYTLAADLRSISGTCDLKITVLSTSGGDTATLSVTATRGQIQVQVDVYAGEETTCWVEIRDSATGGELYAWAVYERVMVAADF